MFSYQIDSIFFDRAYTLQFESTKREQKGHFFLSWTFSTGSRICFLMDLIENIVTIPFALITTAFGYLLARKTFTEQGSQFLKQRLHNLPLSLVGSFISPWLVVEKIGQNHVSLSHYV